VIGDEEGTAFDGGRGRVLEEAYRDHEKSGTTMIPVMNEYGDQQKIDENGNPMWVVYKPNPHNVKLSQLLVTINDPNSPDNVDLADQFPREYNGEEALKTLFDRINSYEDHYGSFVTTLGTLSEYETLDRLDNEIGNEAPTILGLALSNKEKIDSI
jgi:hypothetical protein